MKHLNYKKYPVTFILILLCILVFVYTSIRYSVDMSAFEGYEAGGFMPLALYVDHDYYRLLTANFIHFGWMHLLMNMISLYNIGPFIEGAFGKVRYLILIISSALSTTLLPYLYYLFFVNPYSDFGLTVSGGASGIILGLLGGLAALAIFYRGVFKEAFKSILPSLVIVVIISLSVPTVSLSGHLGGFLGGFLITIVMIIQKPYYLWHYKPRKDQDMTNRPC